MLVGYIPVLKKKDEIRKDATRLQNLERLTKWPTAPKVLPDFREELQGCGFQSPSGDGFETCQEIKER